MPEVALVTGGSRGIGRAIAVELAEAGMRIALNYASDVEAAKDAAGAIEGIGGEVTLVQGDVGDPAEVDAIFDEVEESFGPVSVLVNNAGIRRDGLALTMTPEDFEEVLRVDLIGPFLCSRRALRTMLGKRYGRIVNISSVAGLKGSPGQVNYAAAKAGLIGMTKTLAREVGRKGITVNAVAPGLVATDLTASLTEQQTARLVESVPSKRPGTTQEIAKTVAFLCSDAATYINGEVLVIDGGLTA